MCAILISKVLRLARVNKGSHSFGHATHTFIHIWNEPQCLYFPVVEHHRNLAGTHFQSCVGCEAELAKFVCVCARDGTGSRVTGSAILTGSGRVTGQCVRSVFDQVLSFNMRVYRGTVSTE